MFSTHSEKFYVGSRGCGRKFAVWECVDIVENILLIPMRDLQLITD
jgi:hypothetical protein